MLPKREERGSSSAWADTAETPAQIRDLSWGHGMGMSRQVLLQGRSVGVKTHIPKRTMACPDKDQNLWSPALKIQLLMGTWKHFTVDCTTGMCNNHHLCADGEDGRCVLPPTAHRRRC